MQENENVKKKTTKIYVLYGEKKDRNICWELRSTQIKKTWVIIIKDNFFFVLFFDGTSYIFFSPLYTFLFISFCFYLFFFFFENNSYYKRYFYIFFSHHLDIEDSMYCVLSEFFAQFYSLLFLLFSQQLEWVMVSQ